MFGEFLTQKTRLGRAFLPFRSSPSPSSSLSEHHKIRFFFGLDDAIFLFCPTRNLKKYGEHQTRSFVFVWILRGTSRCPSPSWCWKNSSPCGSSILRQTLAHEVGSTVSTACVADVDIMEVFKPSAVALSAACFIERIV